MENLKNITEFVVVSNLENRALNAGINRAQNWWKNRHNDNEPNKIDHPPPMASPPMASPPIGTIPGQLWLTVLRAQDLHESRLSMLAASASSSERPYAVLECNQQRFQTMQADSNSSNRNPQWTSNNGPYSFNIFNPNADRLTVWIQQQEPLRVMKRNEPKILGMCEINVSQLIGQEQAWLPLRKDNKPVGQVLVQIVFLPMGERSAAYNKIL
jgi:hypothetical protein